MQRYLTFGYRALAIGGMLVGLGGLVYMATFTTPFSADVQTPGFAVASALRLAGIVGVVIGFGALFARQASRTGVVGLGVVVAVTAWVVLWAGTVFTDLFVAGTLAKLAPEALDGTAADARLGLGFLAAFFTVLSLIALGIVTLRARVFSRSVGWCLVAAGVIAVVPLPISLPVTDFELGVLLAVVGVLAGRVPAPAPNDSVAAPTLSGSGRSA